ncbi:hypothetical protein LMH87_012232 [Akanthomyces muscarius]|uniref:Uncharacterized protein n=1 Tax=Akanthomyces muscarius TaxID=2231603 RepID=A0A9W8QBB2_AKAMU|nr:hypothetical protein LMH87_012232 [Akanthomyces muscarius]KAJ4151540.1 hypothetical protein LMH87_012232 [Akanthomyces muscarius]
MDGPFTSKEHRFVLAEMIKTSSVDVYQLECFVKHHGIVPDWLNMQLPRGRNVNECMVATKQLSGPYHSRERNSSGSSHGDYPSISQAMRAIYDDNGRHHTSQWESAYQVQTRSCGGVKAAA